MNSRMSKYYDNTETSSKSRSKKNANLYKNMYEDEKYSNIEGILETPKNNEINIEKIREMILRREQEEKSKSQLVKKSLEVDISSLVEEQSEEKNYDIMCALKQAKEDKNNLRENKYRRLDDEYLEDLKNPIRKVERVPMEDLENDLHEIKELLNTITNNMDLRKLKDAELSLDMFSDLKSDTQTLGSDDPIIQAIIKETKEMEKKDKTKDADDDEKMDYTFDTTNMKLSKKDFVNNMADLEVDDDKNPLLTVFMIILFVVLAILIVFIFSKMK